MSTSRTIKLLLVTDEMEAGGTQRQISLLARSLDRSRFSPEVLYFRNRSFLADELEEAGVPVTHLRKGARLDLSFPWRLRRLIQRGRYDLVHAFSFTAELWCAVAGIRAKGPPLIISVRAYHGWYSPLRWRLKGWVARRSCCVVANSGAGAAHAAQKMRLPGEDIRVVHNGVELRPDSAQTAAIRAELAFSPGVVTALYLGRLVANKNVAFLLRAIARMRPTRVPFCLLIAGEGPLRNELEQLSKTLGLASRVRFLGERRDVAGLLDACDFLVLPSLAEGLSNVLLEAMAMRRALIASDVPGNREVVTDGVQGLLYAMDDEEALARSMSRLIEDAGLRECLGAMGAATAERDFAVDALVKAMDAIYVECSRAEAARRAEP